MWTEITEAEPLRAGDELRLHFKVSGVTFLTAGHVALMESRLKKEPRFTVIRHSIPDKTGPFQVTEMTMDVRIERQPYGAGGEWLRSGIVIAGATIAAGTVAKIIIAAFAGVIVLLSISKIEKLIPSVEGVKATGWTSVQIAASLIGVYIVYKYL